ncbi:MAG: hypothetical protein ACRDJ4_09975 [Actinomycetota bacterium]
MIQSARRAATTAAVVVIALVGGACSFGASRTTPTMRLEIVEGAAHLVQGDEVHPAGASTPISVGDKVVVYRGLALLHLGEGRSFELLAAGTPTATALIESPSHLRLSEGNILATLEQAATMEVAGIPIAAGPGAFRVDRTASTRVAVYRGKVRVGEQLSVGENQQVVVAGTVVPRAPRPIALATPDNWDRRFLQPAIDLDQRLMSFGSGLEAQLGRGPLLDPFALASVTQTSFVQPLLQAARRSDLLIGAAISAELARRSPGLAEGEAVRQVFTLWNDGATFGLIATLLGIDEQLLFERLSGAIRTTRLIAEGRGPAVIRRTTPTPRPNPTPTATRTVPSKPTATTAAPAPGPTPTDVLGNLVENVLGILPTLPLPSPTPR